MNLNQPLNGTRPFGFADAAHEHQFEYVDLGGCAFRYCACGLTHVLWQFPDGCFKLIQVPVTDDWAGVERKEEEE